MDLDRLILADNVVPAVPEALVCVQWVAAPLEGIRSDSGIYPTVEAYVLLGVVADHAGVGRFANAPHLLKIHAITSADVSAMRRRCAKLRYALQRAGGCIPRVLRAEFDVILCDMHAILHPGSTNARALSGEPVDSTGASLDVECTATRFCSSVNSSPVNLGPAYHTMPSAIFSVMSLSLASRHKLELE